MPRYENPFATISAAGRYPTDPTGAILGQMLGRIMFGDPEARQEQELNSARMAQIEASTRADDALADGRNGIIKARGNLAGILRDLYQPRQTAVPQTAAPAAPAPASPVTSAMVAPPVEAPAFGGPATALVLEDRSGQYPERAGARPRAPAAPPQPVSIPPGLEGVAAAIAEELRAETGGPALSTGVGDRGTALTTDAAPELSPPAASGTLALHRSALPDLIGALAMADMGGNIDEVARTLGAFSGDDATARAGLVAGGASPDDTFAITPERADEIRKQGFGQQLEVEGMRDATRRRGQDIGSRDRRYTTDVGSRDRRYATDVGSSDRRYSTDVASGDHRYATDRRGVTPVNDAGTVARQLFPGVRVTQVRRDPNSALGRANPGSWHNRSGGAVDVAPISGMSFDQYVQRYRDAGYEIIEARNEVGAGRSPHATGDHWHLVLGQRSSAGRGGTPRQPRAVSRSALTAIDAELTGQNLNITNEARQALRQGASIIYQRTGNPVTAVAAAKRLMLTVAERGPDYVINADWTGIRRRNGGGARPAAGGARPAAAPARAAQRPPVIRYDRNGNRVG